MFPRWCVRISGDDNSWNSVREDEDADDRDEGDDALLPGSEPHHDLPGHR